MRTTLLVGMALAMSAAMPSDVSAASGAAAGAAIEHVTAVTGGGYFPVMLGLRDGTLGAVVRGGAAHLGRAGRLDWIASRDGGRTWSRPTPIVDSAWDDRNPAAGVMRDGAIVVAYAEASTYNAKGEFDVSAGVYTPKVVRSEDGGRTWSAPAPLDTRPVPNASPYGHIVVAEDGTALMAAYQFPSERAFMLRSRDGGRTWGDLSDLPNRDETALLACRGQRLLAFARCEGSTTHGLEIAESLDGGRSWAKPQVLLAPGQWPFDALRLKSGRLLLVHGNRTGPYGVGALVSDDDGRTWRAPACGLIADDAQSGDCGYPSVVQMRDGGIAAMYYAVGTHSRPGVQQAIVARFREEALAQPPAPRHRVISEGSLAGTYQAFPDACRLRNGDILCVFYAGSSHVTLPDRDWPRGGRICMVRSRDEGRTWSAPEVLYDDANDNRDPHVAQLRDGTVICSFFSLKIGRSGGYEPACGPQVVRSADGGRTWDTRASEVAPRNWYCSAPVRQMPDGTCFLGVYYADDRHAFGGVVRSADGGRTWGAPIPIGSGDGVRLDAETDVLRLRDGVMLAALRGDGAVHMHFATSVDGGTTWGHVRDIGFQGHCPHLTRLPSGPILLMHRVPATSLHISRDDARTWEGPILIDDVNGAYPATVPLKDGSVLVVYYMEGKGSAVRARRFIVEPQGVAFLPL